MRMNIKRGLLAVVVAFFCATIVAPPASAGLFGESDDVIAAREQRERDQEAAISQLSQRVRDLEDSLRQQTGQNEELTFRVREMNDKLDKMQKDLEYRICTLTAQQLGTGADSMNCGGSQQQSGYSVAPVAGAMAPTTLIPPPETRSLSSGSGSGGVLGTLSANEASSGIPTSGIVQNANRVTYDRALNQMGKAQFDEARAGFRTFADTYPKDDLAPQAVYWTGVISFTQKDYASAARAFAEGIKKYPTSTRAPESMFKLGQSLISLGQKAEGCTTLGALPGKYPQAPKAVLSQATAARKGAGCK